MQQHARYPHSEIESTANKTKHRKTSLQRSIILAACRFTNTVIGNESTFQNRRPNKKQQRTKGKKSKEKPKEKQEACDLHSKNNHTTPLPCKKMSKYSPKVEKIILASQNYRSRSIENKQIRTSHCIKKGGNPDGLQHRVGGHESV